MTTAKVTPELLKAAKLFVMPAARERQSFTDMYKILTRVHLMREKGVNIVWASDAHTMFIARDRKGVGFDRITKKKGWPVNWQTLVDRIPSERVGKEAVWVNPKYAMRALSAARVLGLDAIPQCFGAPNDVIVYPLGPDACVFVMPMLGAPVKGVPAWLATHCVRPKLPKKRAKKKHR